VGLLSYCAFFLSGAYAILVLERLPADGWLLAIAPAICVCLAVRSMRPVGVALLGFTLMWLTSRDVLAQKLAIELAGTDLTSSFRVIDFVATKKHSLSLVVAPLGSDKLPRRIRLSWYDADQIPKMGECWQLTVRLRRPRGYSNPVGFDYEGWLFREAIGATGYIREGRKLDQCGRFSRLAAIRSQFVERLSLVLPDDAATAVIMAVTVGARHKISDEQWQQYAITGTSHLMAISGLHIGLAAGGGFLLSWFLLAMFNRAGNLHDQAAIIAILIAALYAALSGFAVPARRALLMLALFLVAALCRRPMAPMRILAVCCIAITIADPLAILRPGFQLSFAAVAILFWIAALHRASTVERGLGQRLHRAASELVPLQFVLFFGLLPLTAVLFGRVSWLAPGMNLLALPVFNLITIPSALLGFLLDGPLAPLGDGLIHIAWLSVSFLLRLIAIAADMPRAELRIAELSGIMLLTTSLTILWVILPASWPGRKLAWLAALGAFYHAAPRPPEGCVDMHTLDVGQGLATIVVTNRHTMVFDTGPSFRSGSDTGRLVVVPFLRAKGIGVVDLVVISHGDNDHAGGLTSLLAATDVRTVISGEPLAGLGQQQSLCLEGPLVDWDGVNIALLHPGNETIRAGNNASCVIEIRTGAYVSLLTGDIELPVERQLLHDGKLAGVELVVVPHHGSRTSSHAAFVSRLKPKTAVISAGYGNRWGFPKDDVVRRWQAVGSDVVNTATFGAISYRMCVNSGLQQLEFHRRAHRRIWND